MKVLYVFCAEEASGAEIVIKRLMDYNRDFVEPHLFIAPGKFADDAIAAGDYKVTVSNFLKRINRRRNGALKLYFLILRNYVCLSFKILRYIKKHDIKVVHGNTLPPSAYLLPAILFSRVFFYRVHWIWSEHDLSYQSGLENRLSVYCAKIFDKTLAVSEAVKSRHKDNHRVVLLYNGLDTETFKKDLKLREEFRENYKLNNDTIVIGIAGTIYPRKGQLGLVNAVQSINAPLLPNTLLIAGTIPHGISEYGEEVLKHVDEDKIKYLGPLKDMVMFYNGCDIIVNNSSNEGSEPLGTTIYEAMACEKIVIASRTGGNPEIIIDGESGYIFEADNEKSLAETIELILKNFNGLDAIRNQARARVKHFFNIDTMCSNYNAILSALAKN